MPGGDDVADLLARTEALRERSRGLTNLVAERRRGLERELAAVADEGVVETLVAEAARAREQLLAVDADAESLVPLRDDAEAAEARAGELRSTNEWAFARASCRRRARAARPRPSSPTRNATSTSRRRRPRRSRVISRRCAPSWLGSTPS